MTASPAAIRRARSPGAGKGAGSTTVPWQALFIVWGPPRRGPRSAVLAREIGIETVFLSAVEQAGLIWLPARYLVRTIVTAVVLLQRRPAVVFVQSPPSIATWVVAAYCRLARAVYIIDAHSAAFQVSHWLRPSWLYRAISRSAVTTLVTDTHWAQIVQEAGGHATVLPDIPTDFERDPAYPRSDRFSMAVVNTWAPDEPVAEIVAAARSLPEVDFYVTGDTRTATVDVTAAPPNVHFTGFLPELTYYALLASADAVACLTTRDHTMQRGANEGLSLARPILTSEWPLLRSRFRKGAVFVDNTAGGICDGVRELMRDHARLATEIRGLREEDRRSWTIARRSLVGRIGEHVDRRRAR